MNLFQKLSTKSCVYMEKKIEANKKWITRHNPQLKSAFKNPYDNSISPLPW